MKIVAIDTKQNEAWQKRWSTLEVLDKVLLPGEATSLLTELSESTLFIAHESAFLSREGRALFEEAFTQTDPTCFLLYVSHPGTSSPKSRGSGLMHVSGVAFPNDRKLSNLTPRLVRLTESLEQTLSLDPCGTAELEQARNRAWATWEDGTSDYFEALWGLSQAYLAATLGNTETAFEEHAKPSKFPHAAAWIAEYRTAVSVISTVKQTVNSNCEQNKARVLTPEFWQRAGPVPNSDHLLADWPLTTDALQAVESLIHQISEGPITWDTLLPAFEALANWAAERGKD